MADAHGAVEARGYWWDDIPNFGDRLAPLLLRHFASVTVPLSPFPLAEATVVTVGSVLEHIPPSWAGVVAGAGRLHEGSSPTLGGATVLAVRGPLSARGLGDVAIGDPGLLADELVTIPTRDIDLGIVPHWSDTRLAHDHRFFGPWSRAVISPWDGPLEVVAQIGRCKKIVTSSLHGAVVADAFGIPRRVEQARRFALDESEGGMFKFRDHCAAVGVPFRIGATQLADANLVADRKDEVYDAFRAIRSHL